MMVDSPWLRCSVQTFFEHCAWSEPSDAAERSQLRLLKSERATVQQFFGAVPWQGHFLGQGTSMTALGQPLVHAVGRWFAQVPWEGNPQIGQPLGFEHVMPPLLFQTEAMTLNDLSDLF